MSNPTSNFGWQMPEPTDLVTDLPADFEVFGQAVDTDFVDLLGGTTGQILSKTSNTDLDFTWVSANPGDITEVTVTSPITGGGSSGSVGIAIQDATTAQKGAVQLENSTSSTSTTTAAVPANVKTAYDLANAAIPKSTGTTAGDVIYYSGASTPVRLGIGSTGNILTVAAGIPSWAAPASSGSFTLLSTTSLSGTSTTISGISQDYKTLQVNIIGLQPGNFVSDVAFGINGDTNLGGVTLSTWRTITNAASAAGRSDPFLTTGSGNMQQNQNNQYWVITIPNYTSTTMKKFGSFSGQYEFPSANIFFVDGTFGNDSAAAVSSIKIELDGSVSMTAGSVEIWGIK